MAAVFLLWHVHQLSDDEEDEKLLGVYESEEEANTAIDRYRSKPGFSEDPTGFQISKYELNKDHWTEGYTTVKPGDLQTETDAQ